VGEPILTTTTVARVGGKVLEGGRPLYVVPMARTGATAHVRRLLGGGPGAWLAAPVARLARVGPGGRVELIPPGFGGPRRGALRVPVGAVYAPLDGDPDNPYWVDFVARIRPPNPDRAPFPTFLLTNRAELYRIAQRVGDDTLGNVFEFPVTTGSMTPARAKDVAAHFAAIRRSLARPTPLARSLGCGRCKVSSSIEAAVRLSAQSVDALTPVISLLAGFAALIAVGAAFVAGVFNVRRRSAEARLSVVGGESRALFSVRAALESTAPALAGAAAGLLGATALARALTPAGTIDHAVVRSALAAAAAAAAVSIAAVAAGAWGARGRAIERASLRHRLRDRRLGGAGARGGRDLVRLHRARRRAREEHDDRLASAARGAALSAAGGGGRLRPRVTCRASFVAPASSGVTRGVPRVAAPCSGPRAPRAADRDRCGVLLCAHVRRGARHVAELEQRREGVRREWW